MRNFDCSWCSQAWQDSISCYLQEHYTPSRCLLPVAGRKLHFRCTVHSNPTLLPSSVSAVTDWGTLDNISAALSCVGSFHFLPSRVKKVSIRQTQEISQMQKKTYRMSCLTIDEVALFCGKLRYPVVTHCCLCLRYH